MKKRETMRSPGDLGTLRGAERHSLADIPWSKALARCAWAYQTAHALMGFGRRDAPGLSDGIPDFYSSIFNSKPSKLP